MSERARAIAFLMLTATVCTSIILPFIYRMVNPESQAFSEAAVGALKSAIDTALGAILLYLGQGKKESGGPQ